MGGASSVVGSVMGSRRPSGSAILEASAVTVGLLADVEDPVAAEQRLLAELVEAHRERSARSVLTRQTCTDSVNDVAGIVVLVAF